MIVTAPLPQLHRMLMTGPASYAAPVRSDGTVVLAHEATCPDAVREGRSLDLKVEASDDPNGVVVHLSPNESRTSEMERTDVAQGSSRW